MDPARGGELLRLKAPYVALKFTALGAQKWVDVAGNLATGGARIAPLTAIIAGIAAAGSKVQDILARVIVGDAERLARLNRAVTQATLLEVDIFSAHYDLLRARAEQEQRTARGAEFNSEIDRKSTRLNSSH